MGTMLAWLRKERTIWSPLRIAVALSGLPSVLVSMACVPVLNFFFSGHGGPGWLALPCCFPVLLFNMYRLVIKPARRAGISPWRRAVAISVAYLVLAYPFAIIAKHRITKDFGLPITDRLSPTYDVPSWPDSSTTMRRMLSVHR